jgi:tRNA-Thr(GGU) m(6)t(6)A37 methyltransferase TsaA
MVIDTKIRSMLVLCQWILCLASVALLPPAFAWLGSAPTLKPNGKQLFRVPSLSVRPYEFLGDNERKPADPQRIRRFVKPREDDSKVGEQSTRGIIEDKNTTKSAIENSVNATLDQGTLEQVQGESIPLAGAEQRPLGQQSRVESSAVKSQTHKNHQARTKKRPPSNESHKLQSMMSDNQELMEEGLVIKPIGVVRSIYRLCVGTPRQGLLAPNARGCIDLLTLGNSSPLSSVEGLEGYSHIWVVFVFHLNTQSDNSARRIKSKISPPALGGQKVGIFATRSPHRFNPIGMTLCKLDRIERIDKRNVKLHISGMDLVDGTPVIDIKPYVPVYDSITPMGRVGDDVRVPDWVEGGLSLKRSVFVTDSAQDELKAILQKNPNALEFYGPDHGEATIEETLESALECIRQVLMMDVRSSYQTKKSRSGKFKAERSTRLKGATIASTKADTNDQEASHCTQQLDNLLIQFDVKENIPTVSTSENSGAEDTLSVTSIKLLVS